MQKVLLIEMMFVFLRHSLKFDHLVNVAYPSDSIHDLSQIGWPTNNSKINTLSVHVRLESSSQSPRKTTILYLETFYLAIILKKWTKDKNVESGLFGSLALRVKIGAHPYGLPLVAVRIQNFITKHHVLGHSHVNLVTVSAVLLGSVGKLLNSFLGVEREC